MYLSAGQPAYGSLVHTEHNYDNSNDENANIETPAKNITTDTEGEKSTRDMT